MSDSYHKKVEKLIQKLIEIFSQDEKSFENYVEELSEFMRNNQFIQFEVDIWRRCNTYSICIEKVIYRYIGFDNTNPESCKKHYNDIGWLNDINQKIGIWIDNIYKNFKYGWHIDYFNNFAPLTLNLILSYFIKIHNDIQLHLKIAKNKGLISRSSSELEKDILSKIGADNVNAMVKDKIGDGIKDFEKKFILIQNQCQSLTDEINLQKEEMTKHIESKTKHMELKIKQNTKKSEPLYQASILGIFITMILSVIGVLKLLELIPSLFDDKHTNKSISFFLLGISIIVIFETLFFLADLFQNNTKDKNITENNNDKESNNNSCKKSCIKKFFCNPCIKRRIFVYIPAIIIFIFGVLEKRIF